VKRTRLGAAAFAVLSGALILGVALPAFAQAASPQAPGQSPSPSGSPVSEFPANIGPSATDPVATVNTLFDILIGRRFEQIVTFACAADAVDLDAHLDFKTALEPNLPKGFDVQPLIDAMSITIPDRAITQVSNDGTNATVKVVGTLVVGVDQGLLRPWVKDLLVAAGQDSSDASVEAGMKTITNSMTVSKDMSRDVNLTIEDGHWLICDSSLSASPSP
jgi:hypothetical protein